MVQGPGGHEFRYTPGNQMVQDDSGRTAAIYETAEAGYTAFLDEVLRPWFARNAEQQAAVPVAALDKFYRAVAPPT